MTERLADVSRQIHGIRQLNAVVSAMRGIAAARAEQGRSLLAGVRAYSEVVAHASAQALRRVPGPEIGASPGPGSKTGVILFCAEQGFAGTLSDRVLDRAVADLAGAEMFLIGTRGTILAEQRRIPIAWDTRMVSHPGAVAALASRVADALYERIQRDGLTAVDVLFPAWSAESGVQVVRRSLMPMQPRRFADIPRYQTPLTTLPGSVLLEQLAEEYVFAELCEAAMQAFVVENEARVEKMGSAGRNIERMLTGLQAHERRVRQEEITAEIVELAGAAGLVHSARA